MGVARKLQVYPCRLRFRNVRGAVVEQDRGQSGIEPRKFRDRLGKIHRLTPLGVADSDDLQAVEHNSLVSKDPHRGGSERRIGPLDAQVGFMVSGHKINAERRLERFKRPNQFLKFSVAAIKEVARDNHEVWLFPIGHGHQTRGEAGAQNAAQVHV